MKAVGDRSLARSAALRRSCCVSKGCLWTLIGIFSFQIGRKKQRTTNNNLLFSMIQFSSQMLGNTRFKQAPQKRILSQKNSQLSCVAAHLTDNLSFFDLIMRQNFLLLLPGKHREDSRRDHFGVAFVLCHCTTLSQHAATSKHFQFLFKSWLLRRSGRFQQEAQNHADTITCT